MSEAKKNNEVKQESASLNPIPAEKRIMSWGSNTMLWLGGCISIGTLAQGSAPPFSATRSAGYQQ